MTGKLVLVTGGAGFIGSHLCERLQRSGNTVISLDNYFAGSRDNHAAGVEYREGHTKTIAELVKEKPDIIFHLGEYSRVEQSLLEPDIVEDLNTLGTKAVVEYWKEIKCKLVYAGSSTKFGDAGLAINATPYARTKAENSGLVKKVGDELKLPYAITYFYNVYGPRERSGLYGTVIEAFKQMYLAGSPISVVKPGTQVRNFTHVDDIIDALILVGEKGEGDEFGLGNERSYSMVEVAKLFGGDAVMLPERAGNRMTSSLDTTKINALGWKATRSLEEYIGAFVRDSKRGTKKEKRVLIFSTTFYPTMGPAEKALFTLIEKMPDVEFDIVTTRFKKLEGNLTGLPKNVHVLPVGFGYKIDKLLLPIIGPWHAGSLHARHGYLFAWSLMASYGALAGLVAKRMMSLPLLVTLADQNLRVKGYRKQLIRMILRSADQVYGAYREQEADAMSLSRKDLRRSIGEGDAFANQLRYAYAEILLNQKR